MAIGLKDIKNPRKDKREELPDQKEKVLRPWETYDSLGVRTRTVAAQEAVKQARITVQKNNAMVELLKKNSYKPKEEVVGKADSKILQEGLLRKLTNFIRGFFI